MTRRRRKGLRFAMWMCVAASLLMGSAWVLGHRYEFGWGWYPAPRDASTYPRYAVVQVRIGSVCVAGGRALQLGSRRFEQGFFFRSTLFQRWRGDWAVGGVDGDYQISVPLWFLSLLPLSPAALFFCFSRSPRPGLCPRCGYDLPGVPDGVCPECGALP